MKDPLNPITEHGLSLCQASNGNLKISGLSSLPPKTAKGIVEYARQNKDAILAALRNSKPAPLAGQERNAPQEPAPGPTTCLGVDCPHASLQHRHDAIAGREILLRWCALSNKPVIDLDTCPAGKWTEKPNMVHQASPTLCRAADTITPCRACGGLTF